VAANHLFFPFVQLPFVQLSFVQLPFVQLVQQFEDQFGELSVVLAVSVKFVVKVVVMVG